MKADLLFGRIIAFEPAGTLCMKASAGNTKPWPAVGVIVSCNIVIRMIPAVMKPLPLNVTYAAWYP